MCETMKVITPKPPVSESIALSACVQSVHIFVTLCYHCSAAITKANKFQQFTRIKFCVKHDESSIEALTMLVQAFGKHYLT